MKHKLSKQLTDEILNDATVNWNLGRRIQEDDPRYVQREEIQLEVVEHLDVDDPQVETMKTEYKEAYTATVFLSGLNHNMHIQITNYILHAFRMGQEEHPKYLTSAYDLAINWKGDLGYMAVPTNDGVDLRTDKRGQDGELHVTDG